MAPCVFTLLSPSSIHPSPPSLPSLFSLLSLLSLPSLPLFLHSHPSHHSPPSTPLPSPPLLSPFSLPFLPSLSSLPSPSFQHTYTDLDPPALESCYKTLTVSLGTLAQLITSFCACYEAELRPWSNRQPPRLSGLGQVCKRVHVHMQHVNKVCMGLYMTSNRKLWFSDCLCMWNPHNVNIANFIFACI